MIYIQRVNYANTIYNRMPLINAGGDSLLCLVNNMTSDISRILLAPPVPSIIDYEKVQLKLQIPTTQLRSTNDIKIDLHCITRSWQPGVNRRFSNTTYAVQGSSWKMADTQTEWDNYGGDFNPVSSSSFINKFSEREYPVTFELNQQMLDNTYGYILKTEQLDKNIGRIYFFSPSTHYVNYPTYRYYINDYTYTASPRQIDDINNYTVNLVNLKPQYDKQQTANLKLRFSKNVYSRDWTTSTWTANTAPYTLPDSMSAKYMLYDVTQVSTRLVIQSSQYTKISCDGTNSYFIFWMSSLDRNRYYQWYLDIQDNYYMVGEPFKVV